jgi:hypothetical protein
MNELPTMTPIRCQAPLSNRHVQTVVAATMRRPRPIPDLRRERLELDDGDFIDVDMVQPSARSPAAAWVLVLHGLAGSSVSPPVRGMAAALVAAGHEVCLMNYRGCSGEPNRLPRAYHGGASEDVRAVMQRLAAARPGRRFAAVASPACRPAAAATGKRCTSPATTRFMRGGREDARSTSKRSHGLGGQGGTNGRSPSRRASLRERPARRPPISPHRSAVAAPASGRAPTAGA